MEFAHVSFLQYTPSLYKILHSLGQENFKKIYLSYFTKSQKIARNIWIFENSDFLKGFPQVDEKLKVSFRIGKKRGGVNHILTPIFNVRVKRCKIIFKPWKINSDFRPIFIKKKYLKWHSYQNFSLMIKKFP